MTGGVNLSLNGHLLKVQADDTARFGDGSSSATHLVRVLVDLSL